MTTANELRGELRAELWELLQQWRQVERTGLQANSRLQLRFGFLFSQVHIEFMFLVSLFLFFAVVSFFILFAFTIRMSAHSSVTGQVYNYNRSLSVCVRICVCAVYSFFRWRRFFGFQLHLQFQLSCTFWLQIAALAALAVAVAVAVAPLEPPAKCTTVRQSSLLLATPSPRLLS